ncbi:MAG: S8 family serine peptidase, partial [Gemmatimonadaceae bacterium]|nr:S8 family serine peptidase [Gemmatimonadaceae bacterium]
MVSAVSARRSHALVAFAAASILALAACSDQAPLAPPTDIGRAQASPSALAGVGSNRRIIALHDGRPVAAVVARIRELGGTVTRAHEGSGLIIASGLTDAAAQSLAQHADVSEVFRDRVVQWLPPKVMRSGAVTAAGHQLTGAPDDQSGAFFFPRFQWNMRVTRASDVWKLNDAHGKGATVCDLDTGIDPTHIDLAGKVDVNMSTSMVVTEPDILDYNGHGTFVSSQIATNGLGMASVAPLATLCQVKVLDKTGAGLLSDAIAGIVYAADAKADVINMSFGAYFTTRDPDFR